MKKTFFLTIILCIVLSCVGCNDNSASISTNVKTLPSKIEDYKPIELNNIIDYNNGWLFCYY